MKHFRLRSPKRVCLAQNFFSRITAGFGYRIPADTLAWTVHWIKKQNADMELEIRRSFDDLTKGKVGVRQKQLDFFG